MAKVVDRVGRSLFEGPLADAKEFVKARFPRVHVDPNANMDTPPEPDVKVVDDAPAAESEDENA